MKIKGVSEDYIALNKEKFQDGYFEVYKTRINKNLHKSNTVYKHILASFPRNSKVYSNQQYLFFSVFLCLMMRYTQNEILSGVALQNLNGKNSIIRVMLQYNKELTFSDVVQNISKTIEEYVFEQDLFENVLAKTTQYTNCLFVYTDSLKHSKSINENNVGTDICFEIVDMKKEVALNIIYDKSSYDKERIRRMAVHYEKLLTYLLSNPYTPICNAVYIDDEEKNLLIDIWNRTESQFPREYCVHQLFEQRVEEDPHFPAIYYENKIITRGDLNKRANQLANYLIEAGVKKGDVVALYSNKSVDYVVGIIGILKAGCAYLPIDSSYPQSRVEFLLDNAKTSIVVTTIDMNENINTTFGRMIVNINSNKYNLNKYSEENPKVDVGPHDPCYLIYTSGSTGLPKGVILNHEGRVNNFYDFNSRFSITNKDKVLAVSSISFDMSAYDILGSMMAGSSVVLPDTKLEKQPFHWLYLIKKYNITIWHSVPVSLELLCKCYSHREEFSVASIRLVLLGGDWIPLSLPEKFRCMNKDATIVSLGGATEVSMDSTIYIIEKIESEWKSIPYGKPMKNQKAYVLDNNRQLLPIGFPGELYLGGVGVGDGYYLNLDATNERFFKNPWVNDSNQKMFKTGDIAYFRQDGNLVLLGRIDHQVKINGIRIELGEIEQCLLKYSSINRAVVMVHNLDNNKKIVVVIEGKPENPIPNEQEIIEYLSKWLPKNYMPSQIILLENIPITPNGKVDRKALESILSNN